MEFCTVKKCAILISSFFLALSFVSSVMSQGATLDCLPQHGLDRCPDVNSYGCTPGGGRCTKSNRHPCAKQGCLPTIDEGPCSGNNGSHSDWHWCKYT